MITPIDSVFSLILPDIERIYKVTGFNDQVIHPFDLISLFIDVVIYYDSDIKCIEKTPVSFKINKSLKDLMIFLSDSK